MKGISKMEAQIKNIRMQLLVKTNNEWNERESITKAISIIQTQYNHNLSAASLLNTYDLKVINGIPAKKALWDVIDLIATITFEKIESLYIA